jgi:hypothetical protein
LRVLLLRRFTGRLPQEGSAGAAPDPEQYKSGNPRENRAEDLAASMRLSLAAAAN